ncbi:hypothetical protein OQA88_5070 [Cercophora sp. LCS_1]
MFGGFAPPTPSPEELAAAEAEANLTVKMAIGSAITLYLSPFVIDAVWKLL